MVWADMDPWESDMEIQFRYVSAESDLHVLYGTVYNLIYQKSLQCILGFWKKYLPLLDCP